MSDLIILAAECAPTEETSWPAVVLFVACLVFMGFIAWLGLR
jgi:hypothetical protein